MPDSHIKHEHFYNTHVKIEKVLYNIFTIGMNIYK